MHVGLLVVVAAVAAGLVYRSRFLGTLSSGQRRLSDDMIRQIEERGSIEIDEPLDLAEIQEAESRFWEETWDEPDEH